MPNRIIKETICTSDNLNSLSAEEEIMFYRIMVNCDDFGIADARFPILRSKCFPLKIDTVKEKDVEKWLQALIKAKLVFMYTVDGRPYLKMTSWENHQQIRAKKSKFPLPPDNCNHMISNDINSRDDIDGNQEQSDDSICHRNPIQSESNNYIASDIKKVKYADRVSMAEEEYNKLVSQYGEKLIKEKIIDLDLWKGSKGKSTKSDYLTILAWIRKEEKDGSQRKVVNLPSGIKEIPKNPTRRDDM